VAHLDHWHVSQHYQALFHCYRIQGLGQEVVVSMCAHVTSSQLYAWHQHVFRNRGQVQSRWPSSSGIPFRVVAEIRCVSLLDSTERQWEGHRIPGQAACDEIQQGTLCSSDQRSFPRLAYGD
jgi:hypothetical protein